MKGREILLVVLIAAIALGSGLIGLYLGRSSVQKAAAPLQTVGGEEIAIGPVRLWDSPDQSNLAFEIQGNRVWQGSQSQGQIILYFDGNTIFRGANATGERLFTVEGDRIFVGPNATGPLAYTVTDGRVWEGDQTGPIIFTIEGKRFYEGANTSGPIVFQANTDLSGDVLFLLPILAQKRF